MRAPRIPESNPTVSMQLVIASALVSQAHGAVLGMNHKLPSAVADLRNAARILDIAAERIERGEHDVSEE